jgi:hypothetical protein
MMVQFASRDVEGVDTKSCGRKDEMGRARQTEGDSSKNPLHQISMRAIPSMNSRSGLVQEMPLPDQMIALSWSLILAAHLLCVAKVSSSPPSNSCPSGLCQLMFMIVRFPGHHCIP